MMTFVQRSGKLDVVARYNSSWWLPTSMWCCNSFSHTTTYAQCL